MNLPLHTPCGGPTATEALMPSINWLVATTLFLLLCGAAILGPFLLPLGSM
jgi:hypothetical protein